jgi:hypothetical protein
VLPAGSLRLADLGYFLLSMLAGLARSGRWFITRIQPRTTVFTEQGEPLKKLCRWLKRQQKPVVDLPVQLGAQERLPCRLVAVRAPTAVICKRRARLKKAAKRRGRIISDTQWAWTEWTILATNIPAEMATWQEVCVLYRVRWQIELLFKLWKSHGQIDVSRSGLADRQLAEVFAKLLGMLVQHWLLLTTVWRFPQEGCRHSSRLHPHPRPHTARPTLAQPSAAKTTKTPQPTLPHESKTKTTKHLPTPTRPPNATMGLNLMRMGRTT